MTRHFMLESPSRSSQFLRAKSTSQVVK